MSQRRRVGDGARHVAYSPSTVPLSAGHAAFAPEVEQIVIEEIRGK